MAHAYTPGLQVKARTRYRARRLLPIAGEVLVQQGDRIQAEQVIARTQQPGSVTPLNLSNILGTPPSEVPRCLLKKGGEFVEVGEPLARTNGIFGFFKTTYQATVAGVIESVSNVTGQLILRGDPVPVEVKAFATGTVAEVIPDEGCIVEATATFIQGIFGIGGEQYGEIKVVVDRPDQDLTAASLSPECKGKVVVGGRRIHRDAVTRAIEAGAVALIAGGIDDEDLKQILGYDLGVAITGTETLGLTLIITEGFGDIAMADHTFHLFQTRQGAAAAVNGATQIRAGVLRPEIVIPWLDDAPVAETASRVGGGVLEIGTPVRLIRDPYFGILGEVAALPSEPQVLGSGSKARVLEVNTQQGERVTVPRANVEIVSE
ncbi:MAG: hypothetical protein KDA90_13370 [Planctomycetaceae bacterium]|nr:hypothetical protein [Planctomycetaceae bacterium]